MSDWQMAGPPSQERKPQRRAAARDRAPLDWGDAEADPRPARALPEPSAPPQQSPFGPNPAHAVLGAPPAARATGSPIGSPPGNPAAATSTPPAKEPDAEWAMASSDARKVEPPAVRTGPSGLLLGHGPHGPVSIRLFRTAPTRLAMAVPDYVAWLLAYRCISLGAHLTIATPDARRWSGLVDAVRDGGGTADLLGPGEPTPAAGRPYRPSVIVDDGGTQVDSGSLGPWQALLSTVDVQLASSVPQLRRSEMALVAPVTSHTSETLRRAYNLSVQQLKSCQNLADHEVALAMPRRVVTIAIPPTKLEYQQLFAT